MSETGPTAPGDETIDRLRKEVQDQGMSADAAKEGHEPLPGQEPAEEEADQAAA